MNAATAGLYVYMHFGLSLIWFVGSKVLILCDSCIPENGVSGIMDWSARQEKHVFMSENVSALLGLISAGLEAL